MPDPSLQQALKEAYASAPSNVVILHTLEFRHPTFTTPIRVVRDKKDLTATLEATAPVDPGAQVTFVAFAFDFALPDLDKTALPEIEITIDNVGGDILPYIDQAAQTSDYIEVTYRPYLSTDLSGPQMVPPLTLIISDITADVFRITAKAGFGNLAAKKFPFETYTSDRFPGLAA
ncbi:MAG: DUF1833 family protein [Rhodocyclaceae bacterium]|nr:DUF1833 family protein [Rhodocyclaceae bacterium]